MNFVVSNTDRRRRLLEASSLSEEELSKLTSKERKERSLRIKEQLESTPGKLDHASIVAFKVGYLNPTPLVEVRRPSEEIWQHIGYASGGKFLTNSEPTKADFVTIAKLK